jgi:protocatechuate 3,4-dioxygenase beta subunit
VGAEVVTPAASEEASSSGEPSIRGIVLSLVGQPVPGASLLAFPHAVEDTLEARACGMPKAGAVIEDLLYCLANQEQHEVLLEELRTLQPEPVRATTDARGTFTLSGLPDGLYEVWVEAPHGVAVQTLAAGTEGVRIQLEEGLVLRGMVRLDGDPPLGDASVDVSPRGFLRQFARRSGADGKFTFGRVPAVEYLVRASKDGLLSDMTVTGPDPMDSVNLSLSRPGLLEGRVVRGGQGVAGVEVQASGELEVLTALTDAQGRFAFQGVRQGSYALEARAGMELAVGMTYLENGAPVEPIVLELQPCATLEGQVLSGPRPLAEAVVFLTSEERSWETSSDASGRYALECVRPGPFLVSVDAPGFQPRLVTQEQQDPLAPGERRKVDWTLQEAAAFDGQVVDPRGQGIPDAVLTMTAVDAEGTPVSDGAQAVEQSDAEGRFSLDGLAPGAYQLTIDVPEGLGTHTERVQLPLKDARFVMARQEPGPGLVVGTVVDEQGQPLEDVIVQAEPRGEMEGAWVAPVKTNAVGQFRLRKLARGPWRVFATREGVHLEVEEPARADVEIHGPEPVTVQLQLASGLELSGEVVDERGAPVTSAWVTALRAVAGQPPLQCGATETDEAGRFTLRHLPPGDVLLEVTPKDRELTPLRNASVPARAGDSGVRIVLGPLRKLSGRVLREDGTPVQDFMVAGRPFSDPGGRFSLDEQLPGTFRFVFSSEGLVPALHEARLEADADAVFPDVVLKRGRPVRGRVLDAVTGQPLEGADLRLYQAVRVPDIGDVDEHLWGTFTEADGSFFAPALEPGSALVVYHADHEVLRVTVPEGSGELVLRLKPGPVFPEPERR